MSERVHNCQQQEIRTLQIKLAAAFVPRIFRTKYTQYAMPKLVRLLFCIIAMLNVGRVLADTDQESLSRVLVATPSISLTVDDLENYFRDRILPEAFKSALQRPGAVKHSLRNLYVIRRAAELARSESLISERRLSYVAEDAAAREAMDALVEDHLERQSSSVDWEGLALEEYTLNSQDYVQGEQVRVSHVLISTEGRTYAEVVEAVAAVQKRLDAGDPFHVIATQDSDDEAAARDGGDLGFFRKGKMDPAFEAAAFALEEPGAISDPIFSRFGVHIIRLTAKKPAEGVSFESAKARLINTLKKQQAVDLRQSVLLPFRSEIDADIAALDEEELAKEIYSRLIQ